MFLDVVLVGVVVTTCFVTARHRSSSTTPGVVASNCVGLCNAGAAEVVPAALAFFEAPPARAVRRGSR